MIDVNSYRKGRHITVKEFGDNRVEVIAAVQENTQYKRLELVFESGDMLYLNATNLEWMIGQFGTDERAWIGKRVELHLGEVPFSGRPVSSILLQHAHPRTGVQAV